MSSEKREYKWVGTRQIRPDGHDKVTGRAKFGSDFSLSGMIHGRVLRSPHAHAVIKSIDTSRAEALPGVKAVITSKDFKDQPSELKPAGEGMVNYRDMTRNVAPGLPAADCHLIDNTNYDIPQTFNAMLKIIRNKK